MLTAIVRQSLRHAWLVVLAATVLLVYGTYALADAPYDVFPDFVPPQASVQTEAPGYTPLQTEQLVTRPLEAVINGANGVEAVRSESIQGLSVINVTFREGSDPYRARQQVAEALADATLPAGVTAPKMTPLVSSTMDLLKVGFVSDTLSPMELRDLVEWTVRPRLLAADGVARANVFGGERRRMEVRADPHALTARGLSLADLASAVSRVVQVKGSGFADTPNQRILIDPGRSATTPAAISDTIVRGGPTGSVSVGNVAEVLEAAAPLYGDAIIMGRPGVLMTLSSQYGANTLDATRALEAALAELIPALERQGVKVYPALHRPANFVENALAGIERDLMIGAVLIALVLILFLRRVQVALVAFVSIPLSIVTTLLVLNAMGQSINVMTLGGLAVALGVVIDDAIVDIENIVRRLRDAPPDADRLTVIEAASVEVRAPVVYATFVLALTMLPVILLTDLQGAFFAPLGVAFLLAVLASLVVAMTVTPALSLLLLGNRNPAHEPVLLERFKAWHAGRAAASLDHPERAAWAVGLIGLAAIALTFALGSELLPTFRERHYVLGVTGPPGASFDWMRTTGEQLSKRLLAIPEVLSVEEQSGRAEAGEDTWPPNVGEIHLRLKDDVDAAAEDDALKKIREVLDSTPAIQSEAVTFLGDRIGESLSGETAQVAISMFGNDLDTLDRVASQVVAVLGQVPGAADVSVGSEGGTPMLDLTLDPSAMALHGVDSSDAADALRAAFLGLPAGQISLADRTLDVVVTLPPELRQDPEAIGRVLVRGGSGNAVPLGTIADVSLGSARELIAHDDGQRRQVVTANVTGRDVSGFVAEAKRRIGADVTLPAGVYLSWAGAAEGESAATRQLVNHVALTAIAMVALLVLAFGGLRPALIILAGLPMAVFGGEIAAVLVGGVLSLGGVVGFITLFGITARNAILLVSHVDHLVAVEKQQWSRETVLRATRERVTPIILTAFVTSLALVPLAVEAGEAGREIQGPMAIVILGGLVSSLILTLLLLPTLIWRWRHVK
ncbi:AcrB/AcrD/AcrF family protein [Altererythrobacter salegens]|uniref:AcrB/AcrD/AcrF family protein n=1 Tax=Croceibacterium salegens TaxID=1737568 RepID=A0A6I4SV73_9SPHN|nr:efflux RND transporter permease subunit [Croceibacterium salegens]MXO58242.1 AcrB/AcrD/AcrF family protein [Croceibacterium salegens]